MISNNTIEWYLEKAINDLIGSLQRRIMINAKTQTPLRQITIKESASILEHLTTLRFMDQHNKEIDQIIVECNETIQKLLLLRDVINHIDTRVLTHLLSNYSLYSYKDLLDILDSMNSVIEPEIQKNYTLVA